MKATIELPDELYQQALSQAQLRGIALEEIVADSLRQALPAVIPSRISRRIEFPIIRSTEPGMLSLEDIKAAQEQMDMEEDLRNAGLG